MNENNCKGVCKKHGLQCVASVREHDRNFVKGAGFGLPELKDGVYQHTHRCIRCIAEDEKNG